MEYPDWFTSNTANTFPVLLDEFKNKPVKFLQIGAYTGDASLWLFENVLTHPGALLIDVDTWEGSDEPTHKSLDWSDVMNVYMKKLKEYSVAGKLKAFKCTSDQFFKENSMKFDFIYIDGDHTSYGVIKDAVNAYEHLNDDGIIAFDDYGWSIGKHPIYEPKMAIDAFLSLYADRIEIIHKEYQLWCRKKPNK